jgi:hypothetical protein
MAGSERTRRETPMKNAPEADTDVEVAALRTALASASREIEILRAETTRLEVMAASRGAELATLSRRHDGAIAESQAEIERLRAEFAKLHKYARRLEDLYADVLASETWRAMEPARRLLRTLRGRPAPRPFVPRLSAAPIGTASGASGDPSGMILLDPEPQRPRSGKITVFMATYPARRGNLPRIVAAILPQCDILNIYLNEYDSVPNCLRHDRIVPVLGKTARGNLRDNGKFYDTETFGEGYRLFIDDDIDYPPDYVESILFGIARFGFRAIVGYHGTIYRAPLESYVRDRTVLPFYAGGHGAFVDQLGTGALGYHSTTFSIGLDAFETEGIADLWFAKRAAERGVPLVALERPADWLVSMPAADDSLFQQAKRDDARESALLRERLVPALRIGPRAAHVRFIQSLYTPAHLERQGVNLELSLSGVFGAEEIEEEIRFALIIPGWNCAEHVAPCLASIQRQKPGGYDLELFAYDDGSDDGTWDRLAEQAERLHLRLFRGELNMGPAFARDFLLRQVEDGQTICVLLDMDDELLPHALETLERTYRDNPNCWMTYGNWLNQNGEINSEGTYTAEEIDSRAYRRQEAFKFTHLRSFRRFLYDRVTPAHLQDENGVWLRYCSDVGLLLPIADQCASKNVVFFNQPMYLYNQYRPTGTQKRFRDRKRQTACHLREMTALPPIPDVPATTSQAGQHEAPGAER